MLTADDSTISKSTIEFCTRHIEVLAVSSKNLREIQLTCLVFQPTMKTPAEQPSLHVYITYPYNTYDQDIIKTELDSSVPYCQVEEGFKFSIGLTTKHLKVICHEDSKQHRRMIHIKSVLIGHQSTPLKFVLQFTPEDNGKNIRITIHEGHEATSVREFNITIEDEPDYATSRRDSQGRMSCLSNNLIETLADVILKHSEAISLGRHLGYSHSTVKKYFNRPDSSFDRISRSGFVDMLSDWRRRVRPSEQVEKLYQALKDAGLSYVTNTILHGAPNFHLALSVVCNDLFFARYRSKNSPRDTTSDRDGEGISTLEEPPLDPAQSQAHIHAIFGGEQLETEKEDSVERLLDVKLLHGSDEDGVHFNNNLMVMMKVMSTLSNFSLNDKMRNFLGAVEDKMVLSRQHGSSDDVDRRLSKLTGTAATTKSHPAMKGMKGTVDQLPDELSGTALWQSVAQGGLCQGISRRSHQTRCKQSPG
nr:uncharacterized protein LOC129267235 [Lytechinus pictus]